MKARVTVIPNNANRELCVYYVNHDSGADSLSCRNLDGADEPKTFWYEYKRLRAGRYAFVVQVNRALLPPLDARVNFEVLPTN